MHLAIEDATPAELGRAHAVVSLASVQTRPADPDAPPPHSADGQRVALRTLVQRRYARELRAGFSAIPFKPGELDGPQVLGPLGLIVLAQRALLGERTAYLAGPSADRLRLLTAWLGGHCAGVDRSRRLGAGHDERAVLVPYVYGAHTP